MPTTLVRVSAKTKKILNSLKGEDESLDEVIKKLIDSTEHAEEKRRQRVDDPPESLILMMVYKLFIHTSGDNTTQSIDAAKWCIEELNYHKHTLTADIIAIGLIDKIKTESKIGDELLATQFEAEKTKLLLDIEKMKRKS